MQKSIDDHSTEDISTSKLFLCKLELSFKMIGRKTSLVKNMLLLTHGLCHLRCLQANMPLIRDYPNPLLMTLSTL